MPWSATRSSSIRKACAFVVETVIIRQRDGFGLASVMARKGVTGGDIGQVLGMIVDEGPRMSGDAALTLIGTGPGTWLALGEGSAGSFASDLRDGLAGIAAVSDQSSGYVIHRLAGPGARTILQRGAAIDLHPAVFVPGSVATTVIAHMGVVLWQVDDAPTYDVALFRSFAGSFAHWLDTIADAL
jgi:sarcosine oxidase subunit gamma